MLKLVALSNLEDDVATNPRKAADPAAMKSLVASIKSKGVIEPPVVRPKPGSDSVFLVLAGRRRVEALRQIHTKNKDTAVAVIVRTCNDNDAAEIALAENVVREQLHPVDEYEAYQQLTDEGVTPAQIAKRFGQKERWVRQRLQLASLAPALRAEWRAGKMTSDQAAALTTSPDHERQTKVWVEATGKNAGSWNSTPDSLRHSLREDGYEQDDPLVRMIGIEAYRSRGGRLSEDLFAEDQILIDPTLVEEIAKEFIDRTIARLVGEGWAWVESATVLGAERWQYRRVTALTVMTDEEKAELAGENANWDRRRELEKIAIDRAMGDASFRAKYGLIVAVNRDGKLEPDGPFMRPGEDVQAKAKSQDGEGGDKSKADDKDEPEIAHALLETLTAWNTVGVARSLAGNPQVALRVVVAALTMALRHEGFKSPLRLSASPWHELQASLREARGEDHKSDTMLSRTGFAAEFAKTANEGVDELIGRLCPLVAETVDLRVVKNDSHRQGDWRSSVIDMTGALAGALDGGVVEENMKAAFDPASYFKRVTAADCIAAIVEIDGRNSCISKKKADLAGFAAHKARDSGWLPAEMRTVHYAGPKSPALKQAAE